MNTAGNNTYLKMQGLQVLKAIFTNAYLILVKAGGQTPAGNV